jgi:hypothetical protein
MYRKGGAMALEYEIFSLIGFPIVEGSMLVGAMIYHDLRGEKEESAFFSEFFFHLLISFIVLMTCWAFGTIFSPSSISYNTKSIGNLPFIFGILPVLSIVIFQFYSTIEGLCKKRPDQDSIAKGLFFILLLSLFFLKSLVPDHLSSTFYAYGSVMILLRILNPFKWKLRH